MKTTLLGGLECVMGSPIFILDTSQVTIASGGRRAQLITFVYGALGRHSGLSLFLTKERLGDSS